MFSKHISLLFCVALFSCHMLIPIVEAGHHHGNNQEGLAVLLAAGLLAKILHHKHHEEHHVYVPVHHEHHGHHEEHHVHKEHHHGSGTTRIFVHHPSPFYNIHGGGMMGAPSMVPRYVYSVPPPAYPPAPY